MKTKVCCNVCEIVFEVGLEEDNTVVTLKQQWLTMIDDKKQLCVTYFDCPQCNHTYTVIIDDDETLKLKKNLNDKIHKINIMNASGKLVPNKKLLAVRRLNDEIKEATRVIYDKYNKSFYQIGDLKEQLDVKLPVAITGQ